MTQTAYTCLPYSVLKDEPYLLDLFQSFGCDPKAGTSEVGIVTQVELQKARKKAADQK
jgi:hypothetical protein